MCEASRDAVNHEGVDVFYHSQVHFEKSTRHFAARAYSNDNRSTTISWHFSALGGIETVECTRLFHSQQQFIHSLPYAGLGHGTKAPMDQSEGEYLSQKSQTANSNCKMSRAFHKGFVCFRGNCQYLSSKNEGKVHC